MSLVIASVFGLGTRRCEGIFGAKIDLSSMSQRPELDITNRFNQKIATKFLQCNYAAEGWHCAGDLEQPRSWCDSVSNFGMMDSAD